jgi:DHA2 family multidrug resistance protein
VGILAIVFSPIVGKNVGRVDPRLLASVAFLVFALVFWMRSNFTTQTDVYAMLTPTIIQGVAMAFFFIPLVSLTLSGLRPDQIPAASGLSNFVRITAGAFGTSIATTAWDNRATLHHAQLIEHITPYDAIANDTVNKMQQNGLSFEQAKIQINQLINQQAFTFSADDIFYVSSFICLLMIGILWLARPERTATASKEVVAH